MNTKQSAPCLNQEEVCPTHQNITRFLQNASDDLLNELIIYI